MANDVAIAGLNTETANIDSYVEQNQGQRFGTMLEDIQEFSTGGMVCESSIGDWDMLKPPLYKQMASGSQLPQFSDNYS
ncbi:C6 transcription factor [Colletotrichum tofieldiae]|nr:C6 transcription factor [Colletotrichum tofieldiae]GKT78179.1 C6 transcription factor [Colletotrichum tofieldiae]